jgi:hypothetical protein
MASKVLFLGHARNEPIEEPGVSSPGPIGRCDRLRRWRSIRLEAREDDGLGRKRRFGVASLVPSESARRHQQCDAFECGVGAERWRKGGGEPIDQLVSYARSVTTSLAKAALNLAVIAFALGMVGRANHPLVRLTLVLLAFGSQLIRFGLYGKCEACRRVTSPHDEPHCFFHDRGNRGR